MDERHSDRYLGMEILDEGNTRMLEIAIIT